MSIIYLCLPIYTYTFVHVMILFQDERHQANMFCISNALANMFHYILYKSWYVCTYNKFIYTNPCSHSNAWYLLVNSMFPTPWVRCIHFHRSARSLALRYLGWQDLHPATTGDLFDVETFGIGNGLWASFSGGWKPKKEVEVWNRF